ncbi:hypothetical protein WMY93_015176 [Mugilogobius chulae]|uniref:Liver-expressed antimicrobial peptide 2 n=1 Tax=Mugilogobius chulae TaxID=88201 RepID=A0AAW0P3P9_9GOBI
MDKTCLSLRETAVVLLFWILLIQQILAGPVVPVGESLSQEGAVRVLRRTARMSPLWRVLNSKPLGAYCQNNNECSTGLCRAGYCATLHRSATFTS